MKKTIAKFLAAAMIVSAACAPVTPVYAAPANEAAVETAIVGGWTRAESPVITGDVKALVEKAVSGKVGAKYVPVAYLASQVVAGTNHAVLCRVTPVAPGASETYAVVYIYEKLDGSAELTEVKNFDADTNLNSLLGGWAETESPALTEEHTALFEKAVEGLLGVDYVPVALLSTQVVAGTNYCFIAESTVVYPGSETTCSLVYIYEDLQGNAKVTEIVSLAEADSEETETAEGIGADMANPVVTYGTLAEAEEAAGFRMTLPKKVKGYTRESFAVIDGKILQVTLTKGNRVLTVRKAAGSEDVSGDYTDYAKTKTVKVNGREVTLKSMKTRVSLASWTTDYYTFSITASKPVRVSVMKALAAKTN